MGFQRQFSSNGPDYGYAVGHFAMMVILVALFAALLFLVIRRVDHDYAGHSRQGYSHEVRSARADFALDPLGKRFVTSESESESDEQATAVDVSSSKATRTLASRVTRLVVRLCHPHGRSRRWRTRTPR